MRESIIRELLGRINSNHITAFMRENNLNGVSKLKEEKIDIICQWLFSNNQTYVSAFKEFLTQEIMYGKNNQYYIMQYDIDSSNRLSNVAYIIGQLAQRHMHIESYNDIMDVEANESFNVVYQDISNDRQKFILTKKIKAEDTYISIYPSVEICPKNREMIIRISDDMTRNKKRANTTTNEIYNELRGYFGALFNIHYTEMSIEKNRLYTIYDRLTTKLIEPYLDEIQKNDNRILQLVEHMFEMPNLSEEYADDAIKRIRGLFERFAIYSNWKHIQEYQKGRLGYVYKVKFSDGKGAKVQASARGEHNIADAEIFFDTRETIATVKALDAIWVYWFTIKEKIATKIEAKNEYCMVHFISRYMSEEIEKDVLPKIKSIKALSH